MKAFVVQLARGASAIAIGVAAFTATTAAAQSGAADAPVGTVVTPPPASAGESPIGTPVVEGTESDISTQDIVVTGTSLRGVAPIGSNLVSVSTAALAATGAQTVTGALQSVPSLSGTTGQGTTAAFYQPSIHQLGASASNSTLVLIDGHRGPTGGTNHTFLDPNIVPFNMIQRVEVLAEGSSSIYGSDAVAGVINFITRSKFDGLQADAAVTVRDGTTGYQGGLLFGKTWDRGSVVFGATYIYQDNLRNRDRDFTFPDHRTVPVGNGRFGANFQNLNCGPASIQPGGLAGPNNIYPSVTSTTPVANNASGFQCTPWADTDLVGKEERQNIMGKMSFDLTDKLTVGLDLLYARRRGTSLGSAGSISPATVFQTGAQANPFYTNPAGITATTQQIRWDATELFGPARNRNDSDSMYASFTSAYELGGDWTFDFLASAGRDESSTFSEGAINQSAALLALNGTTNGGGSLTQPSIPGTTTIVTQLPLTTANALDVWNPRATNRTSQATLDRILDNTNLLRNTSGYQQVRASVGGSLFELPAGPVKVAVGGELLFTQLGQFVTRANAGPARTNSQQLKFDFDRNVKSAFAEVNVPIVSPDMNVPLVHKFDLSLAGRYDRYSDFGSTTNPKIAFNWDIVDGVRFRGNWSTSFVAPPLTILGDEFGAFGTANWVPGLRNVTVDTALFPEIRGTLPGCAANATSCSLAALNGIQVTRGDPQAGAQEGDGWSLGVDFAPKAVPGLRAAVTYWQTSFTGGVTGSQIEQVLGISSANYLMSFYPNCATPAQISASTVGIPQAGTLAACTYYIYQTLNTNWLNLDIAGVDYQIDYDLRTDSAGTFSAGISGTEFTKYTQSFGSGATYDILNTAGNNGTFPSIRTKFRGYLGWADAGFSARAFVNYTGSFRNYAASSTVNPLTRDANGNPNGGGDKIKAFTTFDLNLGYEFNGDFLNGTRLSLVAANVFDKDPPYYNSAAGYYSLAHNPFGRTVTLSLTMKLM
ncbi:TonB-dependent receptor domain-containing protein [Sphingobium algorifonticola]|nr:TonB-dependent receptor [Sphingobium algorifonticola]